MANPTDSTYQSLPRPAQIPVFVSGSSDAKQMKEFIWELINGTVNGHLKKSEGVMLDVWLSEKKLEGGISPDTRNLRDTYLDPLRKSWFVVFVVHSRVGPGTLEEANEARTLVLADDLRRDFLYALLNSNCANEPSVQNFKRIVDQFLHWVQFQEEDGTSDCDNFKSVAAERLPTWFYEQIQKLPGRPMKQPFRGESVNAGQTIRS
jgi:hypothetical protein